MESLTTWIWSAAVFEPALPGRSSVTNGSPVPRMPWSTIEHNWWKAKPFFHVGRASSFSEFEFRRDTSMSMTSGFSAMAPCSGESCPAWVRAAARAVLTAANTFAGLTLARTFKSRLIVGSEATSP